MRNAFVSMHVCKCKHVCMKSCAVFICMWKLTIKAHSLVSMLLLLIYLLNVFFWLVSVAVTFVFIFHYCFCFLSGALLLFSVMAVDSSWPHEWKRSRPDEKTNRRNRGTSKERHTLVDFLYNCVRLFVLFFLYLVFNWKLMFGTLIVFYTSSPLLLSFFLCFPLAF